jgi:hypothetical protein
MDQSSSEWINPVHNGLIHFRMDPSSFDWTNTLQNETIKFELDQSSSEFNSAPTYNLLIHF